MSLFLENVQKRVTEMAKISPKRKTTEEIVIRESVIGFLSLSGVFLRGARGYRQSRRHSHEYSDFSGGKH